MKRNIILLISSITFMGCMGNKAVIKLSAKKTDFPVSLSQSVYDVKYNVLTKNRYRVIKHFKYRYDKYSITRFFPRKEIDLSNRLNELMDKYNGDAIVNLSVKSYDVTKLWPDIVLWPLTWTAKIITFQIISPRHIEVEVTGDIVQVLPSKRNKKRRR